MGSNTGATLVTVTNMPENSDVLPAGSVAVAVTTSPPMLAAGRVKSKLAFPLASVNTEPEPR